MQNAIARLLCDRYNLLNTALLQYVIIVAAQKPSILFTNCISTVRFNMYKCKKTAV